MLRKRETIIVAPYQRRWYVNPYIQFKIYWRIQNSRLACSQLIDNIKSQTVEYVFDSARANQTCDQILKEKKETLQDIELKVREKLENEQVRVTDIVQMKGASIWLSTLPLDEERFNLNKREFCDAVRLRYRWPFKRLPSICPWSKAFDLDHALDCSKGGFVNQRHNLLRNLISNEWGLQWCHLWTPNNAPH